MKNLKMKFKKSTRAIGLLELMLSLAIIAVLLIMATRYYSSASGTQKVQSATDMVNAIKAGVANYIAGSNIGLSDNDKDTTSVTIGSLVKAGYLPTSFQGSADDDGGDDGTSLITPWGDATATISVSRTTYGIDITKLGTKDACQSVATKVNATMEEVGGAKAATCTGDEDAKFSVIFSR